jgi:hypothetical protein
MEKAAHALHGSEASMLKKRLVLLSQFSLTLQIDQCCYIADINAVHMHVTVSTEYRR